MAAWVRACSSMAACSAPQDRARARRAGGFGLEDIFVIHNGQLIPQPDPVRRSLAAIATRVIDASGRAAALGDLFRIYGYAQGEKAMFQWVTIPESVDMRSDEVFDPAAMQSLYDVGYELARSSSGWSNQPPGQRAQP